MSIHPRIKYFIDFIKQNDLKITDQSSLVLLKNNEVTGTEAMVIMHLGFNMSEAEAERTVLEAKVFDVELIEDIAYQTFLYMGYSPNDPNFEYDQYKVKVPLIKKDKDNQ